MTLLAKFEERCFPDPNSGCWMWGGQIQDNGKGMIYGRFMVRRKKYRAHRVAWEIYRGAVPAGLSVLHKCDVPLCVNPGHLFLGTQADNMADRDRKGRCRGGSGWRGHRKLTKSDAWQIRQLKHTYGMAPFAAELYGVSKHAIHAIWYGHCWSDVDASGPQPHD